MVMAWLTSDHPGIKVLRGWSAVNAASSDYLIGVGAAFKILFLQDRWAEYLHTGVSRGTLFPDSSMQPLTTMRVVRMWCCRHVDIAPKKN